MILPEIEFCDKAYCIDFTISFAEVLKILGAALAFGFGFYQYVRGQNWKRAEFIISLIKDFKDNFNVKRAFLILDWNATFIPLAENEIPNQTQFHFSDKILNGALRNHFDMKVGESFTPEEAQIRLILDDFLERLGQFNQFIENKIIKTRDIEIYLGYWIDIIGNEKNLSKTPEVRAQLWQYLKTYKYYDVIELCKRFNYAF